MPAYLLRRPLSRCNHVAPLPLFFRPLYGMTIGSSEIQASGVIKAHGAMMVLAWVFCSSVGVIISRYYKDMWPNSGLLGERVWFQLHRILMGLCVGLTCLAIILAFIFCAGYSRLKLYPDYVHPILGLIVLVLALINVSSRINLSAPLGSSRILAPRVLHTSANSIRDMLHAHGGMT